MKWRWSQMILTVFGGLTVLLFAAPVRSPASMDLGAEQSCSQYMAPKKTIGGKPVGQELCKMREIEFEFLGRKFKRVEIGVTGTLEGYTLKDPTARYANYFNVYPEFVYPQAGEEDKPVFHGIGRYTMESGHSMALIFPADRAQWNGKLFLHNHGAGRSFARGNARAWDKEFDPEDREGGLQELERYIQTWMEKGYAVAMTRRSSLMQGGDLDVVLDDGTVLHDRNLTEQPPWMMDMGKLAGNLLKDRLGALPSRTYWYGHSGGARPGRMVNYKEGINIDTDGTPIIDGIIVDDAGSGLWVPIVLKDGLDTVLMTDEQKRHFVPMIEIGHLLYVNETPDDPPAWRGGNNFLANKRINAKTLIEKGLGNKFRYYEVDGISHSSGSAFSADSQPSGIDLDLLMEGITDLLDAWVEKGVAPPPTRSDWKVLGDANKDGVIENPAIDMPEISCPLGVFHIYGSSPQDVGSTQYKPFNPTGKLTLEPLDARGGFVDEGSDAHNYSRGFVDMNHNGIRDFVETTTEAWQRVGLIRPNETFNRERYVQCVRQASDKLVSEGLFMSRTLDTYLQKARSLPLPEK
ncbi:MAG: hypothetical protein HY651_00005 [Acidobacteria bacterium]|nr:hypothetical protein [Acidobacteriota bacterium]